MAVQSLYEWSGKIGLRKDVEGGVKVIDRDLIEGLHSQLLFAHGTALAAEAAVQLHSLVKEF